MTVFLFLIIGVLVVGVVKYFVAKRKNIATPPEIVSVVSETKRKPAPVKRFEYPKFIPYYKYHGWKKGLQPSTKQEILNKHKGLI